VGNINYTHQLDLAPTKDILDAYKKPDGKRRKLGDWDQYVRQFNALMAERRIEESLTPEELDGACLLCSEATPHHCHRRLVAEYLSDRWSDVTIHHL
ncbi:MAG: DUF488 domain-containing protein, partial [Cyanobacteria bacterium P01_G01_bin.54]